MDQWLGNSRKRRKTVDELNTESLESDDHGNTESLESDDHGKDEEGSESGVSSGDANETPSCPKWLESLKEFKRYLKENGHGNVPQSAKLGRWVNKVSVCSFEVMFNLQDTIHCSYLLHNDPAQQRSQKKYLDMGKETSTMTPKRVKLLEDAGFTWAKTRLKGPDSWNEHYEELKEFKIRVCVMLILHSLILFGFLNPLSLLLN